MKIIYLENLNKYFILIFIINCICCANFNNKNNLNSKNTSIENNDIEDEKESNNKKDIKNNIDFSKAENKTFLWEISGNKLKNKSYLFGTPHLVPLEYFKISNELKKVIKEVKSIAIECDSNPPNPKFNENFDLNKHVKNKKEIEEFKNNIKRLNNGLYDLRYEKLQPLFILDTDIRTSIRIKNFNKSGFVHYDMRLANIIKKTRSLEPSSKTLEYYQSSFMKIPYLKQIEIFNEISQKKDLFEKFEIDYYKKDLKKYNTEDINLVSNLEDDYSFPEKLKLVSINKKEYTKLMNYRKSIMVDQRNKDWIPYIIKYINLEPTLITLGVGHLEGTINGLISEGYDPKPIKQNFN